MIGSVEAPARRRDRSELVVALLLVCVVAGSYWVKTRSVAVGADVGLDTVVMKAGLHALYARHDPGAAAVLFREILLRNPSHYGATFQLAKALDQAGLHDEARAHWQRILTMAESAQDAETIATAKKRLQGDTPASEEAVQAALMKSALDALYRRGDAGAAASELRQVLARNPDHYGATYQLATALDQSGNAAEARPLWGKVLRMAEGYDDQVTMATARARLARTP
jgi:tetratricopeptide (TPR) repeat protein